MNVFIIGAGGVASYFLPAFFNTFRKDITHVVLWDKDVVERKNLERQAFVETDIGRSKVHALWRRFGPLLDKRTRVELNGDWFSSSVTFDGEDRPIPQTGDLFICMADNHRARRDVITVAQRYGCTALIGGNEYISAQAYVVDPRFEEISNARYDLSSDAGSPFRCNDAEALESTPQLAMANAVCASFLVQLAFVWTNQSHISNRDLEPYLPIELSSNDFACFTTTLGDLRRVPAQN